MPKSKQSKRANVPIARIIRFWREQSLNDDKGGSFNLDLYLDYCTIINTRNNGGGNK